jgi:hypothetical protein
VDEWSRGGVRDSDVLAPDDDGQGRAGSAGSQRGESPSSAPESAPSLAAAARLAAMGLAFELAAPGQPSTWIAPDLATERGPSMMQRRCFLGAVPIM